MSLYKSRDDRVFYGVCGGIAQTLDVPSWIVRLIFICGGGLLFGSTSTSHSDYPMTTCKPAKRGR
ncbi:PspC domain-containing protein [Lactiplantibacillus carotarum]|uniref:PspC domain-containing protein n=1 Tax=Lactiplantibacillus carotarum TaxID=2993456 RepID=UPI00298ED319|nr:PspC domain-containing protein [Lactiplantibacillus carotarum]